MSKFKPPKKVKGYTPCLNDEGFFTQTPKEYCNCHHIFYGNGKRALSEEWGMKVFLHPHKHQFYKGSVHDNPNGELDIALKRYAQQQFEERYSHEFYMEKFGVNYL